MKRKKGRKGRPKGSKKNGFMHLNDAQLKAFQAALEEQGNPRNELIMKLTFFLALRVSELVKIKRADIEPDKKTITIQGLKNGRMRSYRLPEKLWEMLAEWLDNNPGRIVFPLSIAAVQLIFKTTAKKAGLSSDYSVHCLRHSIAMIMAEQKKSGIEIGRWLRHRDISSTQTYFEKVLFQDQDNEMDQMFDEIL